MNDFIESLNIFKNYMKDKESAPFHCEHDIMYFCGIKDPSIISKEDRERLEVLGWNFYECDEVSSFRYGSC